MTTCKRGDLVVVEVRFTDGSGTKRRPALVVSGEDINGKLSDVLVCPVSSQPRYLKHPGPADVPIQEWKAVGLKFPSTVRVGKTLSVDKKIIVKRIGKLPKPAYEAVENALRLIFGI